MTDALRNAVAELRREAAELRTKADGYDQAADRIEALISDAPAPQRGAGAKTLRQPRSKPKAPEPAPRAPKPVAAGAAWTPADEATMREARTKGLTWSEWLPSSSAGPRPTASSTTAPCAAPPRRHARPSSTGRRHDAPSVS